MWALLAVVNSQAVNRYRRVTTDSQGPVSLSHCSKTERLAQTQLSCGLELSVIFCTNRHSLPSEQEPELKGQWETLEELLFGFYGGSGELHFFNPKQARLLTLIQCMLGKVFSLVEKKKCDSYSFYHYSWSINISWTPCDYLPIQRFDSLWN